MRVSLDPEDKAYVKNATHMDAYCNGELISDCRIVDEEQGYIIYNKRNANGHLVCVKGVVQRFRIEGKVVLAGMPYNRTSQIHYQDLPSNRS